MPEQAKQVRRQPRERTAQWAGLMRCLTTTTQGNAELAAVWDLVAALWRRDYPVRLLAHAVAPVPRTPPADSTPSLCLHQAIGAALRSPAFTPATAGAVAACAAAHRKSTLHLLSVAYTTISVADTAEALALSPPEALAGASPALHKHLTTCTSLNSTCSRSGDCGRMAGCCR